MENIFKFICDDDLENFKKIVLDNPQNIFLSDEKGIKIPFLVSKSGNLDMMKFIVEYTFASFNEFDKNGRSCLHYAVESNNLELVKYLVEKVGISILKGDKERVTPYHIAYEKNLVDIECYFSKFLNTDFEDMYQNPIREGFFPDPSIVRVEEDYYMVNSSFVYFPCIPVSHSKDLINWDIIGYAIENPKWSYLDELEGGRGYWAPDISYNEGNFYITATYRMNDGGRICRKQMIVSSKNPQGPYTKPVFIEEDGIDPSIFTDEDGKRYMLLNRGARIFEINKEATKKCSDAKLLYYGSQKRAPEGPHLLKKDGWYYLFLAEGGTGINHQISVARSKSLFGNYEPCPYNPIMTQRDETELLQCCGHGKPVKTQNDEWYMVYLCNRYLDGKYGILGRETALDPIYWTKDGWPVVNNLKGPSLLQKKPKIPKYNTVKSYNDNFDSSNLDKNWITIRSFDSTKVKIRNDILFISGSKYDLDSIKARNMVLRRQEHFNFVSSVKMIMPDLSENQNAGMLCYYDENTFIKFGIFFNFDGFYEIRVFEKIGEKEIKTFSEKISVKKLNEFDFKIIGNGLKREFYYGENSKNWVLCTSISDVSYLSSEGFSKGKRFTGATIGMYVYGGDLDLSVGFKEFKYSY